MTSIVTKIQQIKFDINQQKIQEYESAIREFDSMVNSGIITKRGYNIQTIEQLKYYNLYTSCLL